MTHPQGTIRAMAVVWICSALVTGCTRPAPSKDYQDLVTLFLEWTAFERPEFVDGAPDYSEAAIASKAKDLTVYQARLEAIDPSGWPVDQQVDYALVRAQLDGLDFNIRILQPWARDPAFYKSVWTEQSDTPAHEGPTHHAVVELWTYRFPLSASDEGRLASELRAIPPLLRQAQTNLTGDGRDLWITGTGTMQQQVADLDELAATTSGAGEELRRAIAEAKSATTAFVVWLESQASSKTGASGIGKDNYNWSLQRVHLIPMTWDDEVMLLKRELARAHASLKLEEQRNAGLPALVPAADEAEYLQRANDAVTKYMTFLRERNIVTVTDELDPAMRTHIGHFVPEAGRNFFAIASHHEPMSLFAHFYHWFDHAWMKSAPNPSAIRRGALLYNVWDSRSEGMATAMEEIILHTGYYDDNPRAREVVWIMLAQRAARGLASLYLQANMFDIQEAKAFQVEWTPRGWMSPDLDLLGFEQQLYLRQPGYGTSYVTGKYLIDELIKDRAHQDRAHQQGEAFSMKAFLDEFNAAGVIPVSLIRWQLTGQRDLVPGQ